MLKLLLILTLLAPLKTIASQGTEGGGGGDPCENRIKIIGQDIKTWILNGGPRGLNLPVNISPESYSKSMAAQIDKAQVTCVDEKDPGYPVQVKGEAKVCRFDRGDFKSKITCDIRKFQALDETKQYELIHHEYAGLAGLENPNGASSQYEISNQISGYLEDHVVKKLVVKSNTQTDYPTGKGFLLVKTNKPYVFPTDPTNSYANPVVATKCNSLNGVGLKIINCLNTGSAVVVPVNKTTILETGFYRLSVGAHSSQNLPFTPLSESENLVEIKAGKVTESRVLVIDVNDIERYVQITKRYKSVAEYFVSQNYSEGGLNVLTLENEARLKINKLITIHKTSLMNSYDRKFVLVPSSSGAERSVPVRFTPELERIFELAKNQYTPNFSIFDYEENGKILNNMQIRYSFSGDKFGYQSEPEDIKTWDLVKEIYIGIQSYSVPTYRFIGFTDPEWRENNNRPQLFFPGKYTFESKIWCSEPCKKTLDIVQITIK